MIIIVYILLKSGGGVAMKHWLILFLLSSVVCIPLLCGAQQKDFLFMASTIGPIDAGIVGALEDTYEKETGTRVRHVGAGTGAALDLARNGSIDIVLVHARSLEEAFVRDGYGTERIDLMYNDFVILGPAADPAGIRGTKKAVDALQILSTKGSLFVSRGDKSGTHVAEMELWKKAGIVPAGPWYNIYEKGSEGNGPTLRYADKQNAYTVIDRATFLALRQEIKLVVLVENDEALTNYISLIPVSPKKFPRVNYNGAMAFARWLTDPKKGQIIIKNFGVDRYGSPLFFPNSKEWRALKVSGQ